MDEISKSMHVNNNETKKRKLKEMENRTFQTTGGSIAITGITVLQVT